MRIPEKNINPLHIACTVLGGPIIAGIGYCIKNGRINMWAKYKPVRHSFKYVRPDDWWKGIDGNCGITYPIFQNYDGVINSWDDNLNGWEYLRPRGGENEPYRVGDFGGYDPSARNPIGEFLVYPTEVQPGDDMNLSFQAHFTTENSNAINLTDIGNLSNKYLGAIFEVNGRGEGYVTNSKPISQIDVTVIDVGINAPFVEGDYSIYPVLCDNMQPSFGGTISNNFIPFPGKKSSLKVNRNVGRRISASAAIYPDLSKIEYQINLYNPINGGYTFANLYFQINLYNGQSLMATLYTKNYGDTYVGPSETKVLEGVITPQDLRGGLSDMQAIWNGQSFIEAYSSEYSYKGSITKRP